MYLAFELLGRIFSMESVAKTICSFRRNLFNLNRGKLDTHTHSYVFEQRFGLFFISKDQLRTLFLSWKIYFGYKDKNEMKQ